MNLVNRILKGVENMKARYNTNNVAFIVPLDWDELENYSELTRELDDRFYLVTEGNNLIVEYVEE